MYAAAAANPINWSELMRLNSTGVLSGPSALSLGTVPALSGSVRVPHATDIAGRNSGNTADTNVLRWGTATNDVLSVLPGGQSLTLGLSAPAVGATTGFPYLPAIAGVPTGVPTAIAGYAPVAVDSTDSRLYFYSGAVWQALAVPTITFKKGTGLGNYTTVSATYVDMDATNLALTVTVPTGQKVLISVAATKVVTASNDGQMALTDGATVLAETQSATVVGSQTEALIYAFTGDGAAHTFKIRFKSNTGTTTYSNDTVTHTPMMTFWMGSAN
jgi:hypothetical protein